MQSIPDYITHYYEEGNILLKNICKYNDVEAESILMSLKESGQRTWLHPEYLEERRRVETWLYNDKVFTLEEITEVIQIYGLPEDKWKFEELWRYDRFIEAQVWDDRPIWKFIQ